MYKQAACIVPLLLLNHMLIRQWEQLVYLEPSARVLAETRSVPCASGLPGLRNLAAPMPQSTRNGRRKSYLCPRKLYLLRAKDVHAKAKWQLSVWTDRALHAVKESLFEHRRTGADAPLRQ